MKRILINATHPEEIRSALVDGQSLFDLDIENRSKQQKKSNIYKGTITRIESSLEAAFVDYGTERHGFLPLKEIADQYQQGKDNVAVGTEVMVQVEKEERSNKGAALTTFLSLAGRYLVLLPNNAQGGGISRRIEGSQRDEVRAIIKQLNVPSEHSIIVRTAVIGHSVEELQWDINYLVQLWESIENESNKSKSPHFLFQESNIIIRSIRDYLRPSIGEVLIDDPDAYNLGMVFVGQVMPEYQNKIKLYNESVPLFSHYQIEKQIESAFNREVKLPSGGSIIIDMTEALTAIDVNSARSTRGGDIEETATSTNLEAANEIARQLRLRDLGGIIIIDFIDMLGNKNRHAVEDKMRKALKIDRARTQMSRITNLGLIELSRQRIRPSLDETVFNPCPRCDGLGRIRSMRSLALSILRLIEEEAQKGNTQEIRLFSSIDICTFLLNEKRSLIENIERIHGVRVTIVPQLNMENPHYEIIRVRDTDEDVNSASYSLQQEQKQPENKYTSPIKQLEPMVQPAIQTTLPTQAPLADKKPRKPAKSKGLFASIGTLLSSPFRADKQPQKKATRATQRKTGAATNNRKPRQQRNAKPATNRNNANNRNNSQQQSRSANAKQTTRATELIRQKNKASYDTDSNRDDSGKTTSKSKSHNRKTSGEESAVVNGNTTKTNSRPQPNRKPRQRVRKEPDGELRGILDRIEGADQSEPQEPIVVSLKQDDQTATESKDDKLRQAEKPVATQTEPTQTESKEATELDSTATSTTSKRAPAKAKRAEVARADTESVKAKDDGAVSNSSTAKPVEDTAAKPQYQRPANDPRNKRKPEQEVNAQPEVEPKVAQQSAKSVVEVAAPKRPTATEDNTESVAVDKA